MALAYAGHFRHFAHHCNCSVRALFVLFFHSTARCRCLICLKGLHWVQVGALWWFPKAFCFDWLFWPVGWLIILHWCLPHLDRVCDNPVCFHCSSNCILWSSCLRMYGHIGKTASVKLSHINSSTVFIFYLSLHHGIQMQHSVTGNSTGHSKHASQIQRWNSQIALIMRKSAMCKRHKASCHTDWNLSCVASIALGGLELQFYSK